MLLNGRLKFGSYNRNLISQILNSDNFTLKKIGCFQVQLLIKRNFWEQNTLMKLCS